MILLNTTAKYYFAILNKNAINDGGMEKKFLVVRFFFLVREKVRGNRDFSVTSQVRHASADM